ncbi:MAG: helix-turn-helix domain-containing protein [Rudaea sp.]
MIRKLRKERGMSQETFAFECGLNRQFISLLELNQQVPSIDTIYKIAAGLKIRGSDLLLQVEARLQQMRQRQSR